MAACAELEVALLRERTRSGLAAARLRGHHGGRQRSWTDNQLRAARLLISEGGVTREEIAATIGVSRRTLTRMLAAEAAA